MPSYELSSETLKSKFKSKLNNFPLGGMVGRLSQNMGFRVLAHLLEALGKTFAQIFFQIFLYGSMQFLMGFLNIELILWGHSTLVEFGSKYLKKSLLCLASFSSAKFLADREWMMELFLISDFVENYLLYRLKPTAPLTDVLLLRKLKNTKIMKFQQKTRILWETMSVYQL